MSSKDAVFTVEELNEVQARVDRVAAHLVRSTTAWLDVAREIADAKANLKQHAFERFVNEAGFTKAVADKLTKIGECKRLYASEVTERLGCVDGWTTLYEVSKLSGNRIDELLQLLNNDRSLRLSRKVVRNVALGNSAGDNLVVLCTIETLESQLRALTNTQIRDIASKLTEARRLFNSATGGVKFTQHKRSRELLNQKSSAGVAQAAGAAA